MCRIAGIFDQKTDFLTLKMLAQEMGRLQLHGGPDDNGCSLLEESRGVLIHNRLSIIDLSAGGHQPMHYLENRYAITYNGEIYNYRVLRDELQLLGYHFFSQSDTEVILAAYHCWGIAAFTRFQGMYAFALYDRIDKTVTLVRDPAGIKPLYYGHQPGLLAFASEIRAFKAIPALTTENPDWPVFFLAYGHLPEPVTTLKEVKPVPKGCYIRYNIYNDSLTSGIFERFNFLEKFGHPQDAVELIRSELQSAVRRHLVADAVPGVFLSGGLDSAIITLLAAKETNRLHILSLFFHEKNYSEKKFQDTVINQLHCNHHQQILTEDTFHDLLPRAMLAMDMPCCDGINTWFISRLAREEGVKTVLSGVGGDELLGGYPSFNRIRSANILSKLPVNVLRFSDKFKGKFKRISYLSIKSSVGKYLFLRGQFIPSEIATLLNLDEKYVWQLLESTPVSADISHLSAGNQASWLEMNYYMQNQLLRDADVMSMAHGIEIRVPFLDKVFMQTVLKIDSNIKFKRKVGKHLLVEAFRQELPESVWNRPKMGFTFPFREWLSDRRYAGAAGSANAHLQLQDGRMHFSQFLTLLQLHNAGLL